MTDLEDRIREALKDPRRQLPVWPDPIPRIRRSVRRQRATAIAVTAVILAGIVTPLALLAGLTAHRVSPRGHGPTVAGTPSSPVSGLFGPSAGLGGPVPPWAKQLRGEVAYKCGDRICLMRPDGRGSRTLTATFPEWDPAWSPNGRDLTFRGYYGSGDGAYDLYEVAVKGCHLTRLTHQMNGTSSSWAPNGRQIAFSVPLGLYVINADGIGLRRLLGSVRRYAYGVDTPAWSARNRIAYARYLPSRHRTEIYTVNANGSGNTPLTRGTASFAQPSWSPDGKSIAFVANPSGAASIEVAAADGAGVHRVTPRSWTSYSPTWTPGGKIVFLRQIGAPTQSAAAPTSAYIVNLDGSHLRLLYKNLDAIQITWGPAALPRATC